MRRSYRTGESRSLPYGKKMVRGPQRDWRGKSSFKRRSLPEKPHFAPANGEYRFFWSRVEMALVFGWRGMSPKSLGMWAPGYAALKDRTEWVRRYGLRNKLRRAADDTRIRHEVANKRK